MAGSSTGWEWGALGAITLGAAVLRLLYIARVSPDPFYDAAVRSMSLSLHNFFFGAFEPAGTVSIDKPPIDLWLQVVSVKLLGFSSTTLKLPEVFAGIASVPLLHLVVRRVWGVSAGLAAAVAMAVLPVEVITARSDTMDALMMMLTVLALLCLVLASERGSIRWLLAGAAVLGVAFNVKLLESVIALPALALFAYLGLPGSVRRRLLWLLAAGAVYIAVSLSWLTATLVVPARDRPYAIGSTNGSAWNAAFVFNGTERLGGKSPEPQFTVYEPGHHYPEATQSERDHIPIVPPSVKRLLARIGPLSGERLGLMLLVGLLLGIPSLVLGWRRGGDRGDRTRRALTAGIALWTLTGIVLFSDMARLHPRYVEGFTPAVAVMLGVGVAWAASPRGQARLIALIGALAVAVFYSERLMYSTSATFWIAFAAAAGAIVCATLARQDAVTPAVRRWLAPGGVLALVLTSTLAVPFGEDVSSIETGVTDAGYVGALPTEEQDRVSAYLRAHQDGARFEVAAESSTQIGSLIVRDARPVLVLTTYNARVFTRVAKLKRLIAQSQVRYAFLNSSCTRHAASVNPACSEPARWIRAYGTDVSSEAGLRRGKVLWLLPGARP